MEQIPVTMYGVEATIFQTWENCDRYSLKIEPFGGYYNWHAKRADVFNLAEAALKRISEARKKRDQRRAAKKNA